MPTVRVITPPKDGMLMVRRGDLTTDKVAGCPPVKTPAQAVFYQARAGYTGPDEVKYEVTSENGEVATYDVTINVKEPPATSKPGGVWGGGRCDARIAAPEGDPGASELRLVVGMA